MHAIFSKRAGIRGFLFSGKTSDFILNSKFMMLDKKSISHNAMFSLEDFISNGVFETRHIDCGSNSCSLPGLAP